MGQTQEVIPQDQGQEEASFIKTVKDIKSQVFSQRDYLEGLGNKLAPYSSPTPEKEPDKEQAGYGGCVLDQELQKLNDAIQENTKFIKVLTKEFKG